MNFYDRCRVDGLEFAPQLRDATGRREIKIKHSRDRNLSANLIVDVLFCDHRQRSLVNNCGRMSSGESVYPFVKIARLATEIDVRRHVEHFLIDRELTF